MWGGLSSLAPRLAMPPTLALTSSCARSLSNTCLCCCDVSCHRLAMDSKHELFAIRFDSRLRCRSTVEQRSAGNRASRTSTRVRRVASQWCTDCGNAPGLCSRPGNRISCYECADGATASVLESALSRLVHSIPPAFMNERLERTLHEAVALCVDPVQSTVTVSPSDVSDARSSAARTKLRRWVAPVVGVLGATTALLVLLN